jgi:hypothetical protein
MDKLCKDVYEYIQRSGDVRYVEAYWDGWRLGFRLEVDMAILKEQLVKRGSPERIVMYS